MSNFFLLDILFFFSFFCYLILYIDSKMQSRLLISICPTKIVVFNYCWIIMYEKKPGENLLSVEKSLLVSVIVEIF